MAELKYPKRLIEVDLPIKRISAHARRDKLTGHGNISTLHIWWARRPLAACRSVICASLWPDPADPHCPQRFRTAAIEHITAFAKATQTNRELAAICDADSWNRYMALASGKSLDSTNVDHWRQLQQHLFDFIADFAAWDASTNRWFLDTARALTQVAHEVLGGEKGSPPLVVDPFAGGGAIPLEALRVGADAFASDLNPVAVLLNKIVLEYIPAFGTRLADEVRRWGAWVIAEATKTVRTYYPHDKNGATPLAYLWARTIECEGPGCGTRIPLIRATVFSRSEPGWHFDLRDYAGTGNVAVRRGTKSPSRATVASGKAICPVESCGYATPAKNVRSQLIAQNGGAHAATLLAVLKERDGMRFFEAPTEVDLTAVQRALRAYQQDDFPADSISETRPHKNTRGLSAVTRIGIRKFRDLYTARQALSLRAIFEAVTRAGDSKWNADFLLAVRTLLQCAASRLVFQNCSLSRWHAGYDKIEGAFGKQALQNTWDFAESNPLANGPASFVGAIEWVAKVVETQAVIARRGRAERSRAQDAVLPHDSADALITDPPYFAAIPYGDLSDVFYVWEREFIRVNFPALYQEGLTEKLDELIVTNCQKGRSGEVKDAEFFRREMARALTAQRQIVKPSGIGVIVFADSKTDAWEAMLGAAIDAGWVITGSWPLDTESQNRTQAAGSASLQSSVHLVCRPRESSDGAVVENTVGDWRDVLKELPLRIRAWLDRLSREGVVGADAIFACLGPALEIFSRYSRVEKTSGEQVTLREYLSHVWSAVAQEALGQIFKDADTSGFEEDARLTAMWLWTLNAGRNDVNADGATEEDEESDSNDDEDEESEPASKAVGYSLDFDAARKIAQGLGAHLEALANIVQVKGEKARLLGVGERTRYLFGKDQADAPSGAKRKKDKQLKLFATLDEVETEVGGWGDKVVQRPGVTVLDRVHQTMILFAAGRGEAIKRFLIEDGAGRDQRFWKLAQALSALYPQGSDEKRWVDGVLARKKTLGF